MLHIHTVLHVNHIFVCLDLKTAISWLSDTVLNEVVELEREEVGGVEEYNDIRLGLYIHSELLKTLCYGELIFAEGTEINLCLDWTLRVAADGVLGNCVIVK